VKFDLVSDGSIVFVERFVAWKTQSPLVVKEAHQDNAGIVLVIVDSLLTAVEKPMVPHGVRRIVVLLPQS